MKTRFMNPFVVATSTLGVTALLLLSVVTAQNKPAAKPANSATGKATPRLSNGRPDLTGYWGGANAAEAGETGADLSALPVEPAGQHSINRSSTGDIFFDYAGANQAQLHQASDNELKNQPPYKPEYLAKVQKIAATGYGGTTALDPAMDCKPHGVPRIGFAGTIIASPTMVGILYEAAPGPYYRLIYTDGRQHPKDYDSSYLGHSIGHWEGDTLVVDTVGLNDETWLGGGQGTNNTATIHSDQEHVIERITRAGDVLTIETTVEDPVMFTRPWVMNTRRLRLAPPDTSYYYMQPQMCSHEDIYGQNRKVHLVQESETDKFLCGWCSPESAYGIDSDKITTGQTVPEDLKDGLKTAIEKNKK